MKIISEIILIYMALESAYNILSIIFSANNLYQYSEAMHMILSADSPDSEDLNDQK